MGLLSLIPLRAWVGFVAAAGVVACCAWGVVAIRADAIGECEDGHRLLAAAAAEEAHQQYLAGVEEGNRLSAELAATQRRLDETKREYLAYANGISGNCPAAVGVLSNAAARGTALPPPAGQPDATAAPLGAADLAGNIAENYGRANANAAQLSALIRWVEEVVK